MRLQSRPLRAAAVALLESAELPAADLPADPLEHFYCAGAPEDPEGLVGLELCAPWALLRSLVVRPARRSEGLGARLVAHAEGQARAHGVTDLYLLTTTAEPFFARLGYAPIGREAAPAAIRATREFSSLCPASSAFMHKRLG